jgi:hypothetical protein
MYFYVLVDAYTVSTLEIEQTATKLLFFTRQAGEQQ